ncbi:MAG: hypothetical protein IJP96_07220 [Synergistaceae bacterium]|nr:hypothetical protein [Synergistaceae bacterium]MBR0075526.1 hypothetical protein [Synergistaceae bacterium]MBR0080087.1 hypothetical protein [Synergistaceae bacterium]MBR0315911.1 hypothetical protein [Synergistaceae bacterium]
MCGKVIAVAFDTFIVKLGDNLFSIIELPPGADTLTLDISAIYAESDVDVFDEIQGELLTEGPVELQNLSKNKTLNVVIRKANATKNDLISVL